MRTLLVLLFLLLASPAFAGDCDSHLLSTQYERLIGVYFDRLPPAQVQNIVTLIENSVLPVNPIVVQNSTQDFLFAKTFQDAMAELTSADWRRIQQYAASLRKIKKEQQIDREDKAEDTRQIVRMEVTDKIQLDDSPEKSATLTLRDGRTLLAFGSDNEDIYLYLVNSEGKLQRLSKFKTGALNQSRPVLHELPDGRIFVFVGSHDTHFYALEYTGKPFLEDRCRYWAKGTIYSNPKMELQQDGKLFFAFGSQIGDSELEGAAGALHMLTFDPTTTQFIVHKEHKLNDQVRGEPVFFTSRSGRFYIAFHSDDKYFNLLQVDKTKGRVVYSRRYFTWTKTAWTTPIIETSPGQLLIAVHYGGVRLLSFSERWKRFKAKEEPTERLFYDSNPAFLPIADGRLLLIPSRAESTLTVFEVDRATGSTTSIASLEHGTKVNFEKMRHLVSPNGMVYILLGNEERLDLYEFEPNNNKLSLNSSVPTGRLVIDTVFFKIGKSIFLTLSMLDHTFKVLSFQK